MNQREQVIEVIRVNGGYATLSFLYQNVDVKTWKTKTPYHSIRRIVQNDNFFFKIRPGLWALNDLRETVLSRLNLIENTIEADSIFNHSYYQGLLVEIGKLMKYSTIVPNQDRNKKFLDKRLIDLIDMQDIFPFTYNEVLNRAKMIDVIWFNKRRFPESFFEIEHSTDFHVSLSKFAELQDFNSKFYIVAPNEKRKRFEQVIGMTIFAEIKSRIKFWDYDYVSRLHEKTFEFNLVTGEG